MNPQEAAAEQERQQWAQFTQMFIAMLRQEDRRNMLAMAIRNDENLRSALGMEQATMIAQATAQALSEQMNRNRGTTVKLQPPEEFKGQRNKSRNFILQLMNIFNSQPEQY